jgi:hypothetical protein
MTTTPEAREGTAVVAGEKPAAAEMMELMLTTYALRYVLPIVAEAGVADLLIEGPRSVAALGAEP